MLVDLHQSHKISEKVKPIKWQIGKQSISITIKSSNIELEDMVHIATKIEM
jgi:hypothetical protein